MEAESSFADCAAIGGVGREIARQHGGDPVTRLVAYSRILKRKHARAREIRALTEADQAPGWQRLLDYAGRVLRGEVRTPCPGARHYRERSGLPPWFAPVRCWARTANVFGVGGAA